MSQLIAVILKWSLLNRPYFRVFLTLPAPITSLLTTVAPTRLPNVLFPAQCKTSQYLLSYCWHWDLPTLNSEAYLRKCIKSSLLLCEPVHCSPGYMLLWPTRLTMAGAWLTIFSFSKRCKPKQNASPCSFSRWFLNSQTFSFTKK